MSEALTKRCGRCGRELPLAAFNRMGAGTQHWCRECFRAYFRARGDLHLRQSGAARAKRVAVARAFGDAYLASHPCVDCGERDRLVLDFDHVGGKESLVSALVACGEQDMLVFEFDHVGSKRGQISRMVFNVGLATLEAELAQCEIRCCNCHRRVTAARRRSHDDRRSTLSVEPP